MIFHELENLEAKEIIPGHFGKFIHTETMTFAYWQIQQGAKLREHSHPHEQVANLLVGEYELTVDGETKKIGKGSVATIPGHAVHSGVALTDCVILDVFNPVRKDYAQE